MAPLKAGSKLLAVPWTKAALVAALTVLVSLSPLGAWLEVQFSDLRERSWAPSAELAPVTVVAIDEPTLDSLGSWPWPRDQWERALTGLHTHYSPLVVALDLVFPPGATPDADDRLGRQLARYPMVLGQLVLPNGTAKGLWREQNLGPAIQGYMPVSMAHAKGTLANSPAIATSAASGHINALLDGDGVLRRYVPAVCWQAQCSVSLGLATVARAFSVASWQLVQGSGGRPARLTLEGLDHLSVPLVPGGGFHVPWQRYHAIPVVSLHDVVKGRVDPRLVNDRLLMVGSTAPGLADNVVTPVLTQMPGVMAHAVVASAIVDSGLPGTPPWAWPASLLLFAAGAAFVLARPWRYGQLAGAGLLGLILIAVTVLPAYHLMGWIIPVTVPAVGVILLTLVQMAYRLGQANQDLVRRMTTYLPAPLVLRLSRRGDPKPQLAWSTLLYADTVAYTAAAQRLRPDQLAQWVNTGLDIVIRLVERHGGVVENIAGDGLLAYWDQGSPREQANQALRAALVACRALQAASAVLRADGLPALDMGLGLHAGPLLAGSYGAGERRRFTVHGEAANVAQRIEKATRQSPYRLLMSESLAGIQTRYHAVSTDHPLTVGNATVPLYTITRKTSRRTA